MPSGSRAATPSSRATAGAAVVIPARADEARRRPRPPAPGDRVQEQISPPGEIDAAAFLQQRRPVGEDHAELVERLLPVERKLRQLRREARKTRRIDLLDQQLIERARQVRGEAQRFGGVAAAVVLHQPADQHQPPRRLDRRRDRRLAQGLEHPADPLVELGIADRHQTGQQQAAAGAAHERILDRAGRAIIGDEHDPFGEPGLLAPMQSDQPRRQGVGEGAVRRDGEDLWSHGLSLGTDAPAC